MSMPHTGSFTTVVFFIVISLSFYLPECLFSSVEPYVLMGLGHAGGQNCRENDNLCNGEAVSDTGALTQALINGEGLNASRRNTRLPTPNTPRSHVPRLPALATILGRLTVCGQNAMIGRRRHRATHRRLGRTARVVLCTPLTAVSH